MVREGVKVGMVTEVLTAPYGPPPEPPLNSVPLLSVKPLAELLRLTVPWSGSARGGSSL
jgi:hypothetical protein